MSSKFLDNLYNKLCENKNIKESLLNIKKYIDYSFIFLYIIIILILIIFFITIILLLTIIYLLNKTHI
jgi:hypothetical protein